MATERQLRLDHLLQRGHPPVLKPGHLLACERLGGEFPQGHTAPQRQSPLQCPNAALRVARIQLAAPLGQKPLKPPRIHSLGVEPQLVAVLTRHHQARRGAARPRAQRLAQSRNVDLQRLGGRGRRTPTPQLVDQPVRAQPLVDVQQQHRQQRPLLAPPKRNPAALIEDFERTEDEEVHASNGRSRLDRRYSSPRPTPNGRSRPLTALCRGATAGAGAPQKGTRFGRLR